MSGRKTLYLTVLVLLVLFSASVAFRIPTLDRPLSNHHEWLTSSVLRHQQIWYEAGALNYAFCPPMTYDNAADRNINNGGYVKDAQGNYYYTSYAPFSYILPYLIFRAFNIYPDVLPLEIFNLACHIANCVLIFMIVAALTKERYRDRLNLPAVLAFSVYLFSQAPMWFHSNVYMADMLAQTFFIAAVYVAVRYAQSGYDRKYLFPMAASVFFMAYSEWIGLIFVAALILLSFVLYKEKRMRPLLYAAALGCVLALTLMVWQYSQIDGFDAYFDSFMKKYLSRSGLTADEYGDTTKLSSLPRVAWYYALSYGPAILVLLIFTYAWLKLEKKKIKETLDYRKVDYANPSVLALYLSAAPVLLHHMLAINFTMSHDFSVLKTGLFFAVAIGLLYDRIINSAGYARRIKNGINLLLIFALLASLGAYWYTNVTWGMEMYPHYEYRDIGLAVSRTAARDEVVFMDIDDVVIVPQIVFYAHRNIALWESEAAAKELIRLNGASRGILYNISSDKTRVEDTYYVYPDS